MQKSRSNHSTYTIQSPLSFRRPNQQNNYYDQTSNSTSVGQTYDSRTLPKNNITITRRQNSRINENEEHSGLNTSGGNSTIFECVKMLETSYRSSRENSPVSLRESFKEHTRKFTSMDLRIFCQDGLDNFLAQQDNNILRRSKPDISDTIREFNDSAGNRETEKKDKDIIRKNDDDKENAKSNPAQKYQVISTKSSSKSSISKISGSVFSNPKTSSTSSSANVTARRRRREPSIMSKESQSITQSTRFVTSPLYTDRDIVQSPRGNHMKAFTSSQLTSPKTHKGKDIGMKINTEAAPVSSSYQGSLWRRDSVPQKQTPQSPKQSLQLPLKPLTVSLSRNVQVLATPRGEYMSPKNNQKEKGIESARRGDQKQSGKKESMKFEGKINKEKQGPKSTRIDLIEVDLTVKGLQKKKEGKIEESLEQLDKVYEKLRKEILERKEDLSKDDKYIDMIDELKGYMMSTQILIKGNKTK